MSTLRNAAPRRTHLERPQPASRTRSHPLLEKHKDYALRAADHNLKKSKLKILREKAAGRNEDEFAFGMLAGVGSKGRRASENVGGARGSVTGVSGRVREESERGRGLSTATVQLLKGQDKGYVRVMRDRARRRRERLGEMLLMVDRSGDGVGGAELQVLARGEDAQSDGSDDDGVSTGRKRKRRSSFMDGKKHTIFVDDTEAQATFSPTSHFNTDNAGLGRAYNRPRIPEPTASSISTAKPLAITTRNTKPVPRTVALTGSTLKKRKKNLLRQRAILASLKKQEHELATAERELDAQRAKMRGDVGASGVNKAGVKWKVKGRKR